MTVKSTVWVVWAVGRWGGAQTLWKLRVPATEWREARGATFRQGTTFGVCASYLAFAGKARRGEDASSRGPASCPTASAPNHRKPAATPLALQMRGNPSLTWLRG
jgi:hypothetical protein